MGEENGKLPEGFHFSNSPDEIAKSEINLNGRTIIQRTSCGTKGVVNALNAKQLITGSFMVADATIKHIQNLAPKKVSFIITGTTSGDQEDVALANYLKDKLEDPSVDPTAYVQQVKDSKHGQHFTSGVYPHYPKEDLDYACNVDAYSFAMEVTREGDLHIMRKIIFV